MRRQSWEIITDPARLAEYGCRAVPKYTLRWLGNFGYRMQFHGELMLLESLTALQTASRDYGLSLESFLSMILTKCRKTRTRM